MYSNVNVIKTNQNLTAALIVAPSRLITENSLLTRFASSVALAACSQQKFSSISRTTEFTQGSGVETKARQKSENSEGYTAFTGDSKSAFFIEKIINLIMRDGEKSKASQIFYNTLTTITEKKFNENAILATSFVSNQVKSKPLVFHKEQVQRVSSPLFNLTASPIYSAGEEYSQSKSSYVFSKAAFDRLQPSKPTKLNFDKSNAKKVYYPRVYPSTEPLLFNSMLLSDTSRSPLKRKTKGFFSSIVGSTSKARLTEPVGLSNKTSLSSGKANPRIAGFTHEVKPLDKASTLTYPLEAQALLYDRRKVYGVDKITLRKLKHDIKSKPASYTTLLTVLALLSLTGKYTLNEKLTTFFSVLKAKTKSTVFIKVVKVLSHALPISIYNKVSELSKVKHVLVIRYTPSTTFFATAWRSSGTKVKPKLLFSTSLANKDEKANTSSMKAKGLPTMLASAKKSVKISNSFVVNETQRNLDSLALLALLAKQSQQSQQSQQNKQQVALQLVKIAINNVKPSLEVRKVRIAGTTYQVPAILEKKKSISQAIRWIIESARTRKNRSKSTFSVCLAEEFLDAFQKQGKARQKRDQLHNIASANRAYIRYRWW